MPEQANSRERFQKLLAHLGVTRVVCVDDRYDARFDVEDILGWAAVNPKAMPNLLKENNIDIDYSAQNGPAELGGILRDEANAQKAIALQASIERDKLKKQTPGAIDEAAQQVSTDRSVLNRMDQLMEGYTHFYGLSPVEWDAQRGAIEGWLQNERVLFLFDETLGRPQTGSDYIAQLSAHANAGNALFGLLSYTVQIGQEHERTKQFQANGILATAISKEALKTEKGIGHVQLQVRAAALQNESRKLQELAAAAMADSIAAPTERLNGLSPLELDEIIFRSSYEEGAHEMDTLIRIYTSAFAAALRENLRGNVEALKLIGELRAYRGDDEDDPSPGSTAWKLQRDEYYEQATYVNSCNMPPEVGDLFKVSDDAGGSADYVLVAAPCDLVVRKTGLRKSGIDRAWLCAVRNVEPDRNKLDETFPLDYFSETTGAPHWAYFAESFPIDLWLLDICALNHDGVARFNVGSDCPDYLSDGWQVRFESIKQKATMLADAAVTWPKVIVKVRYSPHSAPAKLVTPGTAIPTTAGRHLKVLASKTRRQITLTLGLERTARLGPLLSSELVQAYCSYLSRPARPHSLALNARSS